MFRSGTGNPQVKHETGDEVRIEATQTGSKKTGMFVVFVLLVDPVSGSAVEQGMGTIEDFFNKLLLLKEKQESNELSYSLWLYCPAKKATLGST